jgi:hypothetical protein
MDAEFLRVDAERRSIDEEVEANAKRLGECPALAPVAFTLGAVTRVQTHRCSPERAKLLKEQRELFQRRNEIYARWRRGDRRNVSSDVSHAIVQCRNPETFRPSPCSPRKRSVCPLAPDEFPDVIGVVSV